MYRERSQPQTNPSPKCQSGEQQAGGAEGVRAECGTGFLPARRDRQTGLKAGPTSQPMTVTSIVLAGTQSWGECPLERVVPRPLAPIINVPLVNHVLSWLGETGITRASICGNSITRLLRNRLGGGGNGNGSGVPQCLKIDYYQDVAPRGPAGCVKDAGSCHRFDACVVVEGTILPTLDLSVVIEAHQRSGASLTVVVYNGKRDRDAGDEVLVPLGIYIFSRRALDYIPVLGYQDIKETLIPRLYQCGESVLTYRTEFPAARVTSVDSYLAVNEWALSVLVERGREHVDYGTGFCGTGFPA
ncbi:MAG: NDP-sugar synthase, partial [Phycisphaerae bacterium]